MAGGDDRDELVPGDGAAAQPAPHADALHEPEVRGTVEHEVRHVGGVADDQLDLDVVAAGGEAGEPAGHEVLGDREARGDAQRRRRARAQPGDGGLEPVGGDDDVPRPAGARPPGRGEGGAAGSAGDELQAEVTFEAP